MSRANVIDKLVDYFNPKAGFSRAKARTGTHLVCAYEEAKSKKHQVRAYEGAKTGRRTDGWVAASTSANAEIFQSQAALRNRSRSMLRDSPYAVKAITVLVANTIGTGITAKWTDGQDLWNVWCRECDADGQFDWYGLQGLIARTVFESGECLIRLRHRLPSDGLAVPLQLQVMEPDYLDSLRSYSLPNGGYILNGIEFDALGKRVAYWIYNQHPGEQLPIAKSFQSRRVDAAEIIHVYEKTRPGQVRGVPRISPVLLKMRDLDDYEEAELLRKGIEACFAAVVTSTDDDRTLVDAGQVTTDSENRQIEQVSAGMFHYAKQGQSVQFGQPHPLAGYNEFITQQLHSISAGWGVPYFMMTGDLSKANYSSMRGGQLEFRRTIEVLQWLTVIPMLMEPVALAFANAAWLVGKLKKGARVDTWTPPKWDWVDPVKDVAGELLEIAAGLKPWQEAVRRRGADPQAVLKQIKEDQDAFKAAGVAIQIDALALGAAAASNSATANGSANTSGANA